MTAIYTLAHSCLQDSPLSVSPSSTSHHHHHHHGFASHSPSNSTNTGSIAIQRRSSLSNHSHPHSIPRGSPLSSSHGHSHGFLPSYSHHSALPLNIANSHQIIKDNLAPIPPPVLSVSPPKQRSNTIPPSSHSSSTPSPNSGISNLFQHHARPATATATASATVQSSLTSSVSPSNAATQQSALPRIHSLSVIDTFAQVLSEVDIDSCEASGENAFLVCDLARVYSKYLEWQHELGGRIEPFFAVKCNPDPLIIKLMVNLGIGFDCASHQEIKSVLQAGGREDKIVYANPCKAASFIRYASKVKVDMMTFDNEDELIKVAKFHPNAKMILRILTDDSGSLCRFGLKFGAPLNEVRSLLQKAKELNVNVIGISFHVGSGCTNPLLFADAVRRAKWAFNVAEEIGYNFTLLDVGGGFGGDNFKDIASVLRDAVEEEFPVKDGVRVIAEPGRYFVAEAFEMATNIIARRGKASGGNTNGRDGDDNELDMDMGDVNEEEEGEAMVMYYINDGVYGAFNCTMFDHQVVHPKVLTINSGAQFISSPSTYFPLTPSSSSSEDGEDVYEACSIWGPTCDSIDCVSSKSFLPTKFIKVGDWLRWENMGAYTICAASQFNGFKQSKVVYTIQPDLTGDDDVDGRIDGEIRRLLEGQKQ